MGHMETKSEINIKDNGLSIWQMIYYSILVGLITGIIISINKILILNVSNIFSNLYSNGIKNIKSILFIFATLIILSIYIAKQIIKDSSICGSGLPQVEGILAKKISINWGRVIINKFITLAVCSGAGLSIGTCGPSIQIGACIGGYISSKFDKLGKYEKYLIKSGVSAGMASVFIAPLSAIIFTIEKLMKNKSILFVMAITVSSFSSYIMSKYVFGLGSIFNFKTDNNMEIKYYWILVILGIISGISGFMFSKIISYIQNNLEIHKVKWELKVLFPFIITGIIGLSSPNLLGGGSYILQDMQLDKFDISTLILLTLIKYILIIISLSTLVPGGIFLPILTLGALIGKIVGMLVVTYFGMENEYIIVFIVVAMAAHFVSVLKVPLTSIALICEITGSVHYLVPIILGVAVSQVCTKALVKCNLVPNK